MENGAHAASEPGAGPARKVVGSGVEPPVSSEVREAFGHLEQAAPAFGARWAAELWCTPPVMESDLRMPPGVSAGEPLEAHWEGHRIAGESWGEGPTVYLVHGWGGRRPHLGMFVKPLVEAGHRVVAFDLPSHNESESGALKPGRTTIVECGKAVAAVIHEHGPARAVVAHSLGAKAAVLAAGRGARIERFVFLAPMGDFSLYLDLFADRHGFGPRVRERLRRRLDQRLGVPLFDTDIPRAAAATGYPPLLLVHDPDDLDSLHETSEEIAASWPGARLLTTKGLGRLAHYRILRHRPGILAGVAFIDEHGADEAAEPVTRSGS